MSDIAKTLKRLWVVPESAHQLISVVSLFFSDRLELPVSSWSGSSPTASTPDWRPWRSWPSCRQTPPSPQSSSTWRASGRWRVWWRAAPSELDGLHVSVPVLQHVPHPVTGSARVKSSCLVSLQLWGDVGLHPHRLPGADGSRHRVLGPDLPVLHQAGATFYEDISAAFAPQAFCRKSRTGFFFPPLFIHLLCLYSCWKWVGAVAKLPLILCGHCCACMTGSHSGTNAELLNDLEFQK